MKPSRMIMKNILLKLDCYFVSGVVSGEIVTAHPDIGLLIQSGNVLIFIHVDDAMEYDPQIAYYPGQVDVGYWLN